MAGRGNCHTGIRLMVWFSLLGKYSVYFEKPLASLALI